MEEGGVQSCVMVDMVEHSRQDTGLHEQEGSGVPRRGDRWGTPPLASLAAEPAPALSLLIIACALGSKL